QDLRGMQRQNDRAELCRRSFSFVAAAVVDVRGGLWPGTPLLTGTASLAGADPHLFQHLRQRFTAAPAEVERAGGEGNDDAVLVEGALQSLDGLAARLEIVRLLGGEV